MSVWLNTPLITNSAGKIKISLCNIIAEYYQKQSLISWVFSVYTGGNLSYQLVN